MKRLLMAGAILCAVAIPAKADIIVNLGPDPTSGAGAFANTDPGTGAGGSGLFLDTYNFSLTQALTLTIAFAVNTFAGGPTSPQFIQNFTGAVLNASNVVVLGPEAATPCVNVPNCQGFGGSANLGPGLYHLAISGNAGADAGYGGNISTFAVPGPIAGAGLPGMIALLLGLMGLSKYRRKRLA